MTTKFEISTERATLVAEIEKAEKEAAHLEAERRSFEGQPTGYHDRSGAWHPFSERSGQVLEFLTEVNSKVSRLRNELERLDQISAYWRSVETSAVRAESARRAAESAEQQLAEIEEKITRLQQRIEVLQTESHDTEAQALAAESTVTQTYARSLAVGDEKKGKVALAEVQKAQGQPPPRGTWRRSMSASSPP
jgi:chromosome segregation ATPase